MKVAIFLRIQGDGYALNDVWRFATLPWAPRVGESLFLEEPEGWGCGSIHVNVDDVFWMEPDEFICIEVTTPTGNDWGTSEEADKSRDILIAFGWDGGSPWDKPRDDGATRP